MPSETRTSLRLRPTLEETRRGAVGVVGARRSQVPQAPTVANVSVPDSVDFFICKNVGPNEIRFNFNDDNNTNYWSLGPGETLPCPISLRDDVTINVTAIGGTSDVECLFWG